MSSVDVSLVRKLFKGGGILVLGFFLDMAVSFVGKVFIGRYLGTESFGTVSLGITTLAVASTLLIFGLDTGIARYLPRYDDDSYRRGILLSGFQIGLVAPLAFGLLMVVFAERIAIGVFDTPSAVLVFRIVGVILPLSAFVNLSVGAIQGEQKASPKVVIRNFALPLTRFSGFGIGIVLGVGVAGIVGAYLFSYLTAAAICLYYLWTRTDLFSGPDPTHQKQQLLAFSFPIMISSIGATIFSHADIVLLGYLGQVNEIGIYSAVYPVSQLVMFSLNAFAFIFMPIFSELHADQATGQMKQMYQAVTKWVVFGSFPAVVMVLLFPELMIELTFGADYTRGGIALSVLVLAFGSHTLMGPNAQALTAMGNTRLVMIASLTAATLNLILNLLLIPYYSFLGAAIATTASYIAMNLLLNGLLYWKSGIHPFTSNQFTPLLTMGLILGSVNLFVLPAVNSALIRVGVIVLLFVIVYPIVVLRYGGFGKAESIILSDVEKRFGVDLTVVRSILSKVSR